jgi:hypothetical protein
MASSAVTSKSASARLAALAPARRDASAAFLAGETFFD